MEIEADRVVHGLDIPSEMLLPGRPIDFGSILAEFRTGKRGKFMEHADYRIAKDGAFIHRALDGRVLVFYFRGSKPEGSERPYVILRRLDDPLRSQRWKRLAAGTEEATNS